MINYSSLPSFDTFKGKVFWCGVCSLLAVSFAVSATATILQSKKV